MGRSAISKGMRVQLYIPKHELDAIDEATAQAGLNRSQFMVRAALQEAARREPTHVSRSMALLVDDIVAAAGELQRRIR